MVSDRLTERLGIELPIVQAPMAGANGAAMAIAVSSAGGLGSLPGALLTPEQIRSGIAEIRAATDKPFNLNFFCHRPVTPEQAALERWKARLVPYYQEFGIDPETPVSASNRAPFDEGGAALVEELRPPVVSFHFGLPDAALLSRVKATGAFVLSSATTVGEAKWLEAHGADAVIAQGAEAGGHRGIFLTDDVAQQPGTIALVPQVVDAVSIPVIAAGGISDPRGVAAAFLLGASAVQVGTAYLFTPQATITDMHRDALGAAEAGDTALTNVFSGRPARGIVNRVMREVGPLAPEASPFPTAGGALAPLKKAAEAQGSGDFSSLWSGQGMAVARQADAGDVTRSLADGAARLLNRA
ncbi:NAD(P)H-dependent flavin oxidoreductase [Amorphus orientalis]|uniref:Nitronate monooxygenase n=1 Tax=Amorphus orientalis TaxID=649198 RepID=A0AAE4ATI5_9HYPH|nr:nitronate monooxygenase family protein [Amorphus orientalis]MDQ0317321.1 nitronate monooxygenase [Amorphus orientalis]